MRGISMSGRIFYSMDWPKNVDDLSSSASTSICSLQSRTVLILRDRLQSVLEGGLWWNSISALRRGQKSKFGVRKCLESVIIIFSIILWFWLFSVSTKNSHFLEILKKAILDPKSEGSKSEKIGFFQFFGLKKPGFWGFPQISRISASGAQNRHFWPKFEKNWKSGFRRWKSNLNRVFFNFGLKVLKIGVCGGFPRGRF